ncbi:transposase [Streptomyces noursei]|uniref:transposase n=1 Tax=Streptomyces noursei TaxID=1971 RepID=UPI0033D25BD7
MPVVPSLIIAPVREEFLASLPQRVSTHPLGCHRRRIPDEVVFDKLIEALVSGMGYERVADATCSATTLRRRRDEWIAVGAGEALRLSALASYDRMIGLGLEQLSADGCQNKAPSGGECAGKSPVDRAKQGVKRSQLTEAYGNPLVTDPAPANIRDHTLLPATLDHYDDLAKTLGPLPEQPVLSLDAGYDYRPVYADLDTRGITAKIAKRGEQTPIQADGRWVVERTNSWMNNFGKLRRCTERRRVCVEFFIALATAIITIRSLIRRAWTLYRWPNRPRSPRIR